MLPPRVRLVVLNYNGGALVERCVSHLEALDWPPERLDLVLVDNCSTDGSDVAVERAHPRVRVHRTDRNLGFPGNNVALRDLDDVDFVGLINNDAFVDPGLLGPLVAAMEADPRVGATSAKIVFEPRFARLQITAPVWRAPGDGRALSVRVEGIRVDDQDVFAATVFGEGCFGAEQGPDGQFHWLSDKSELHIPAPASGASASLSLLLSTKGELEVTLEAGGAPVFTNILDGPRWIDVELAGPRYDIVNNVGSMLLPDGSAGDRGFLEVDAGQYERPEEVFAWCGAGVLFRPAYLQDVGLFDERFFMYYEDTDLAWRGRARGWRYRYVPEARMRHVHAATSGEWSPQFRFWVERNRLYLLTKNAPANLAMRATIRLARDAALGTARGVIGSVLRLRRPSLGPARAQLRSLGSYLCHLAPMLRDRRRLRRAQTVSDAEILAWAVSR